MGPDPALASRRRIGPRAVVLGSASVALVAFVLVWFQPQKLWIDDRVAEAPPVTAASSPPDATPIGGQATIAAPPAPRVDLARGSFISREHHTAGVVRLLDGADGRRVVRIEGLDTSNGPDLYVYLSAARASGARQAFDDDYVSLGHLKGNRGDQNYDVPAGTNVAHLATVVIWCDRFDAVFGAADLSFP